MTRKIDEAFREPADVAQLAKRTPAAINAAADRGLLRIAARTRRGSRLFLRESVEHFLAARAARARASAAASKR